MHRAEGTGKSEKATAAGECIQTDVPRSYSCWLLLVPVKDILHLHPVPHTHTTLLYLSSSGPRTSVRGTRGREGARGGSRSAGQLGEQRGTVLVTSTSPGPPIGTSPRRADRLPGHLWSLAGAREGRGGGGTAGPQRLFSGQAICSARLLVTRHALSMEMDTHTHKLGLERC